MCSKLENDAENQSLRNYLKTIPFAMREQNENEPLISAVVDHFDDINS